MNRHKPHDSNSYPFSIPSIKNLNELHLNEGITFIIGENGTGKSTLVEAIAIHLGFNPEGGSKNFQFATRETHSDLWDYLHIERSLDRPTDGYFLRAETFYNVASEIEKLDNPEYRGPKVNEAYGGKPLHEQSHGEAFFSLLDYRLSGNGFYIFDEPEAALSPQRQLAMLTILDRLVNSNSQLIIATHSPIIMAYPHATIYQLSEDSIQKVDYKETEHYQITRSFLDCPERSLKHLINS